MDNILRWTIQENLLGIRRRDPQANQARPESIERRCWRLLIPRIQGKIVHQERRRGKNKAYNGKTIAEGAWEGSTRKRRKDKGHDEWNDDVRWYILWFMMSNNAYLIFKNIVIVINIILKSKRRNFSWIIILRHSKSSFLINPELPRPLPSRGKGIGFVTTAII